MMESCQRRNLAHDCIELHSTDPFNIILPLSRYDLNNVERDVKHQTVIIIAIILHQTTWMRKADVPTLFACFLLGGGGGGGGGVWGRRKRGVGWVRAISANSKCLAATASPHRLLTRRLER